MKIIYGILGLLILVLVLCFALSNQQPVTVAMWPLSGTVSLPLYVVGLVPLAFGLLFGGLWGWASGVPHRFRVRWLSKELEALNDKLAELQKSATAQLAPLTRKKHFWERKS